MEYSKVLKYRTSVASCTQMEDSSSRVLVSEEAHFAAFESCFDNFGPLATAYSGWLINLETRRGTLTIPERTKVVHFCVVNMISSFCCARHPHCFSNVRDESQAHDHLIYVMEYGYTFFVNAL